MRDPKTIVRDGYDAIADRYLATRSGDSADLPLLDAYAASLPDGARVLDLGCGAGVPVTQRLAQRCRVIGIDISAAQLALARRLVPQAAFTRADMSTLPFRDAAFDAIVSFYAIIHLPREEHPALLRELRRVLKPGGSALLTLGANDNPGDVELDWLGGGAAMHWSHYDRATNLRLLLEAGLRTLDTWDIMEDEAFGGGSHLVVRAER